MIAQQRLSQAEYTALSAVVEEGTQRRAAERLKLRPQTIKNHLSAARDKSGAVSTVQLAYMLGSGELDRLLP